ncbi:spore coat protein [Bacillus sp. FJAT-42376]|nr:spore coat protein [Bacillus sp. FJAT-42376]
MPGPFSGGGPFPGSGGPPFSGRQPFNGQLPGGRGLLQGGNFGRLGGQSGLGGPQGFGGINGFNGGQIPGAQQAAGGGIRGLLSRFMPSAGGAGNIAGAAQQGITGLANPSNITGMLGNVQKVLGMAQQVTPMVQQYGPLVRNLPAMIKMFSQLNSDDGDEGSTSEEKPQPSQKAVSPKNTEEASESIVPEEEYSDRPVTDPGTSKPRLYV